MSELHIVGVDLAKRVFHLHGTDLTGNVLFQKKLTRPQFEAFLADLPICMIAMEACGSAHHWGRVATQHGHEVRLVPVQHVKPFVKRHKNDSIDAAAIVMAAMHPATQFVAVKTQDQQAQAMLFRTRELLVGQRVQLTNALRGHFAEHGVVFAQTGQNTKKLLEACWEILDQVPQRVAQLARTYMRHIESAEIEIGILNVKIKRCALQDAESKRLQTMPGVGPQDALAIQAFCPPVTVFSSGRDFAAWLGLVPRQHSTGGKQRLGRITKMGQRDIRRLLIIGATSVIAAAEKKGRCDDPWLANMTSKKPRLVVAVALANRMARRLWAMLTKEKDYEIRGAAA
ncbi:hypothetical protein P775_00365 [Puniceibacterium antarcticum]|uniref:Uncharacterized protein n=1 Tax=Puniceibacterium antarcticum TaxID=1206336 RepID=A0A2G8RL27_9RHOB|nr:IS110 family transposase [Puniceibacterium antarcticum]PIL22212.1 hypothetical protein P775_00365 [Puniceibacterium antarcticum]